jgi:glycolate oxidase iron-sulfur subunit
MTPNGDRGGFAALDSCVHCGFCLSACPTYLATGDESDSPRGRILLMRAFERGELAATDAGLGHHLELCLGCRGCEPVCPSGVGYGRGLTEARTRIARATGLSPRAKAVLAIFRRPWAWRGATGVARWARTAGLSRSFAGKSRLGFLAGMVDATTPRPDEPSSPIPPSTGDRGTVALFRGCVMDGLFGHVHEATRRTLAVNGYRVIEVAGQGCCGALHEHAGDSDGARALAERNVAAFLDRADYVVVNSAGCGALLKDLGHLVGGERAARLARSVRDVSELLGDDRIRQGAPLELDVCYDAPCHLQHAQGVHREPLAMLGAIPGLTVRLLPGSDRCCGSAGIYGALNPEMSRAVLDLKIATIAAAAPRPDLVVTGNPGCLMQIGAGLAAAELPIEVAHPVELLDWSYRRRGLYRATA